MARPIPDLAISDACWAVADFDRRLNIARKRKLTMKSQNELKADGRILRDRLAATGENPVLLAKLNHLVDAAYLQAGDLALLRRLLGEPL
jgi:hypothetical protein